jgi:hypothetical protein
MRWFIDNMFGWWLLLLAISLGISAFFYELFLKQLMK